MSAWEPGDGQLVDLTIKNMSRLKGLEKGLDYSDTAATSYCFIHLLRYYLTSSDFLQNSTTRSASFLARTSKKNLLKKLALPHWHPQNPPKTSTSTTPPAGTLLFLLQPTPLPPLGARILQRILVQPAPRTSAGRGASRGVFWAKNLPRVLSFLEFFLKHAF